MRKYLWLVMYSAIGLLTFFLDRITKQWAMANAVDGVEINQFLSLDLVFNRGVTAGLLQSDSPVWFAILSFIIGAIIVGLSLYMIYRWHNGRCVIAEMLTISGAVSNLIDRYLYNGVVDFIHITFYGYSFPIFNIADMCIVLGVAIMFLVHMKDDAL